MLYSVINSGVSAGDPQVESSLNVLTNFLTCFGLPDSTQDLSWLVALYTNLPQDDPARVVLTKSMVSKLVSGCVLKGDHEGLWGTLSVNPVFAQKIATTDAKYAERYLLPIQEEIKEAEEAENEYKKRRLNEELQDKLQAYLVIQDLYRKWALSGQVIFNSRGWVWKTT